MTTRDPNELRDPRFDTAWRAASREEPPPALDDAIRAAARREAGAGPQRAGAVPQALRFERWWWPLAAAATIGAVAIGVLQLAGPDNVGAPTSDKAVVSDMPVTSEPAKKQQGQATRDEAPQPRLEQAVKPAAVMPAAPASSDVRDRVAPSAAPASPPTIAPTLRKDVAPPPAGEERAAANVPATPVQAPAEAPKPKSSSADSAAPEPRVAEPFPADTLKRESKEGLAAGTTPTDKTSASGGASFATGKLQTAPAPARSEPANDAQRAAAPPAAAAPAPQPVARRMQEAEAPRPPSAANASLDAASASKPDARAKVQPKLPVADWIALIRKLRDERRSDDAAKELAAFRAAYPDHERLLPPDLRDWHPTVR